MSADQSGSNPTTGIDWLTMGLVLVFGATLVTWAAAVIGSAVFAYAAGFCMGVSVMILGVTAAERGLIRWRF
jgi:hypothetical protein